MIKLFSLILFLFAAYAQTLNPSQSFGLYTIKGEPLELLQLETKAITEGPYVEIQYAFLYKNPSNSTIQTKFVFPLTINAVFHKFDVTIQNQTISAKVVENPNPLGRTLSDSDSNDDFLNVPAQETMYIIFAMSQPLNHLFNILYELKLPAFINGSLSTLQSCHLQIELRSCESFVVLSNPSHQLIPSLSEEQANSQKIYKAVWNATIAPDQDFIVYFGPENLQKPQFILAAHPHDPQDHVLLLNSIPKWRLTAQDAQKMFESYTNDTMIEMMNYAFDMLMMTEPSCLFIIDRSDSMKGTKIESLKQRLKQLVEYSPYCDGYSFLSFGSSFELYAKESDRYDDKSDVYEWIDTIEADMGGSDLLKVLQHFSDGWPEYEDLIIILLTDGDISHPDKVIKYLKDISAIVAIGDETSNDIIKYLARADGGQIDFVLANEGLEGVIFDLMEERYYSKHFSYGYSVKCWDSQNQEIYKERELVDIDSDQPELFRKWFYLSNITNLRTCDIKIEGAHENHGEIFDKAKILNTHIIKGTDIWHKVAYDAKIKQLQEDSQRLTPQKQKAIQEQILNLALQYQILSPFTSLALPTISSTARFFDLSNFNKRLSKPPVDLSNFVVPKNYIPLDSIQPATLKKPESIDL